MKLISEIEESGVGLTQYNNLQNDGKTIDEKTKMKENSGPNSKCSTKDNTALKLTIGECII